MRSLRSRHPCVRRSRWRSRAAWTCCGVCSVGCRQLARSQACSCRACLCTRIRTSSGHGSGERCCDRWTDGRAPSGFYSLRVVGSRCAYDDVSIYSMMIAILSSSTSTFSFIPVLCSPTCWDSKTSFCPNELRLSSTFWLAVLGVQRDMYSPAGRFKERRQQSDTTMMYSYSKWPLITSIQVWARASPTVHEHLPLYTSISHCTRASPTVHEHLPLY
ncbi:hypothetical protein C8Q72DRAFT_440593 [Fomitopsis betulina]|nr:hypothetical protein C8Q72DRAFT_440593 [Fomitopsis betulina]